jgi:hypothetical protein
VLGVRRGDTSHDGRGRCENIGKKRDRRERDSYGSKMPLYRTRKQREASVYTSDLVGAKPTRSYYDIPIRCY